MLTKKASTSVGHHGQRVMKVFQNAKKNVKKILKNVLLSSGMLAKENIKETHQAREVTNVTCF